MSQYRKIWRWGVRMFVLLETETEMILAARLSLVPIGVEARREPGGWAVFWVELPAGFDRPEARIDAHEADSSLLGVPEDGADRAL